MSTLEDAFANVSGPKHFAEMQERCNASSRTDSAEKSCTGGQGKEIKSAFQNRITTLSYNISNEECLEPTLVLNKYFASLQNEVNSFLRRNHALKINIEFHVIYTKPTMKNLKEKIFRSEAKDIYKPDELRNEFSTLVNGILRSMEHFRTKDGGWTLLQLVKVCFNLCKYQPLRGAGYIPLPLNIYRKKACINVLNKDEYCFKWAVLSAICDDARQPSRRTSYKVNIHSEIIKLGSFVLNFKGLLFPLRVNDISIFEENNSCISINVLGYDKETNLVIGPLHKSKKKREKHINLLFYEDVIDQKTIGHYVWIKSLTRLIGRQVANHYKLSICEFCFKHFYGQAMEQHRCGQEDEIVRGPDKCVLEFKNYVKAIDVPFVMYASSECLFQYDNLMPYVFKYFIKCSYNDELSVWRSFQGSNAIRLFAKSLIKDAKHFYKSYSIKVVPKIPLTAQELLQHDSINNCHICAAKIEEVKVKLHCRLSGKYMGPAHHRCAFSYRIPKKFPVVFYNLSYNDCLSFIKVFTDIDDDPIDVRPLNNDTFACFTKYITIDEGKLELRFLNFCMFMPFSLDYLVQKMTKSDFKTLKLIYPDDENKYNLIIKKCFLPYNYLNSPEKLTETSLPDIQHFNNNLIDKECSPEDYGHAKNIWTEFECKTIEDYLLICMKLNIILLTDIFEKFRLVCKTAYSLDPCNFHSTVEFSWDAMLKITDMQIKLITDKNMIAFIQKGMRGPISHCFPSHSVANNKYLCDYNEKLPSKYVMCFHANDLYGRVMSEPLPDGHFEWETDIENFSVDSIPYDSKIGYILEVDLQYPSEIHNAHKMFPFCIENNTEEVNKEFVGTVNHKHNYIIYYKNLQQCLRHGLKLVKIHRILKFNQSDWLKKYISLNKTSGKSPFEINVFELINSAIYEKIMERISRKIKVVKRWENKLNNLGARALIVKHAFSSVSIYDENVVAVELNKNPYRYIPIYLEFVIAELAKLRMYSFHYEYMMPKYKTDIQLNYIDTDSLIYTITTNDLYKDITTDIYLMMNRDDSNKSSDSRLALKTLGMMKDANDGEVVKEFLGLRSKLYSLKTGTMKIENTKTISLEDNFCNYTTLSEYKNLLYNKQIYGNLNLFKLQLHQRYINHFNEVYLNCLDNDRYGIIKEDTGYDDDDHVMVFE